jgi:flagellar biosynthesis protein FlhG
MTQSITVASGKGGVGKTSLSINIALAMCQLGSRVCLLDTDFGLANAHILLGIDPRETIQDVISGGQRLSDIRQTGPLGLQFIAGGSGLNDLLNLDDKTRFQIIRSTESLADDTDVLIIDAPAGAADSSLAFVAAADKPVVVLVGEPTSFMDAYALIKAAHLEAGVDAVSIVVNMANSEQEARSHFDKFQAIAARFLDVKLYFAGYLPYSQSIRNSIVQRKPIMAQKSDSREAVAFKRIAANLIKTPANTVRGIGFLGHVPKSEAS